MPVEAGDFKLISRPFLNKILDQDELTLMRFISLGRFKQTCKYVRDLIFKKKLNSLFIRPVNQFIRELQLFS